MEWWRCRARLLSCSVIAWRMWPSSASWATRWTWRWNCKLSTFPYKLPIHAFFPQTYLPDKLKYTFLKISNLWTLPLWMEYLLTYFPVKYRLQTTLVILLLSDSAWPFISGTVYWVDVLQRTKRKSSDQSYQRFVLGHTWTRHDVDYLVVASKHYRSTVQNWTNCFLGQSGLKPENNCDWRKLFSRAWNLLPGMAERALWLTSCDKMDLV